MPSDGYPLSTESARPVGLYWGCYSGRGSAAAALAGAGVKTVIRYYPLDTGLPVKRLSLAEAQSFAAAGLRIAARQNIATRLQRLITIDVGMTFDNDHSIPGSGHVNLVVGTFGPDRVMIADNQNPQDAPHERFASGHGKTPTDYFLRA